MKLRGHHLICLQFYHGKGYNQRFTDKLNEIVERARSGEKIEVIYGVDELCAVCPYLADDTCNYDEESRDTTYQIDKLALELLNLSVGETTFWDKVERKLPEIIKIWRAEVCKGCEWREICESYRGD